MQPAPHFSVSEFYLFLLFLQIKITIEIYIEIIKERITYMKIIINNTPVELPGDVNTVAAFAAWKGLPLQGTAIALNGKLVKADTWHSTVFKDLDSMLVISAAFGG